MENQKGNRSRANNGPISMDLLYWMDWENHTQFRLFSTFLYAENKRLYAINEGRKRGENAHIPEGWFDFEEHRLEEIMGINQRNIRIQLRKMESLGLVSVRDGRKRTGKSSKNGRGSVSMNLYRINKELLQRLDAKYPGQRITLENIKTEFEIMTKEEAPSCYTQNKPFEAPKTVGTSNPTPAVKEEQIEAKECDIAISERTLESHPEEDEEIIDIMFNIVDKENPGGLVEEYCQGHQENAELMRHYFKLYMRQKGERENAMYSTKKDIPAKVEETPAATEDTVEMPADLSRKVKAQLQPYLKNIPEKILNKVMDSMYKAKVGKMKREKWQLTMLPALYLEGVEGKIWIQQLWNNF